MTTNPTTLQLVLYPNKILKEPASLVTESIPQDTELQTLMDSMVKTVEQTGALGLAAPQVNVPLRILVARDKESQIIKMINPVIVSVSQETLFEDEGCLSFPGLYTRILRHRDIRVRYFDQAGEMQALDASGLLARVVQHEIDHLDGKTFLDRMNFVTKGSVEKRAMKVLKKLKKLPDFNQMYI